MSRAELIPVTLRQARRYVADHHRHNEPPMKHRFSIGLERDGKLVGVVIADSPVARMADDGRTLELRRLTTEGDRNACSRLYSAACRAAFAMGYLKVITYTLEEESGVSLRASGFVPDGESSGGSWSRGGQGSSRGARSDDRPTMFDPPKMPTGPKRRWVRAA
jgi:hypothetical protein